MSKRKFKIMVIFLIIATAICINSSFVSAKNANIQKQVTITNKTTMTNTEKLALIDKYQKQYFAIIKKRDLNMDKFDYDAANKDMDELQNLFKEVGNQATNQKYLKKYDRIEKRYSNCKAETTTGIKKHADKHYNAVNGLLNQVYDEVQKNISTEDAKKLAVSQEKWIKDIEDYTKAFEAKDSGTLGGVILYEYQIDTRNFRTLLLMLYL